MFSNKSRKKADNDDEDKRCMRPPSAAALPCGPPMVAGPRPELLGRRLLAQGHQAGHIPAEGLEGGGQLPVERGAGRAAACQPTPPPPPAPHRVPWPGGVSCERLWGGPCCSGGGLGLG